MGKKRKMKVNLDLLACGAGCFMLIIVVLFVIIQAILHKASVHTFRNRMNDRSRARQKICKLSKLKETHLCMSVGGIMVTAMMMMALTVISMTAKPSGEPEILGEYNIEKVTRSSIFFGGKPHMKSSISKYIYEDKSGYGNIAMKIRDTYSIKVGVMELYYNREHHELYLDSQIFNELINPDLIWESSNMISCTSIEATLMKG